MQKSRVAVIVNEIHLRKLILFKNNYFQLFDILSFHILMQMPSRNDFITFMTINYYFCKNECLFEIETR